MQKGVYEPLPADINDGVKDVSRRIGWNAPADDAYALPTETWREHVARRQRHDEIWEKLVDGEIHQINDLITLNLDIRQFAQDVILDCEGPELLRAFWKAIREISVLDPACGSGAFLFAALSVLEPLYDACLERMEAFVAELDQAATKHSPAKFSDFREYLSEVQRHPNRRYYIVKSIVIGNLYGVDIMEEAVEICKLRLFLKLAAQADTVDKLEPLPDIDFNIRAGNTLIGFTSLHDVRRAMTITPDGQHRQVFPEERAVLKRIEQEAQLASAAFNQFRWQQTMFGQEVTAADKANLRHRLDDLSGELDRYLATEYGVGIEHSEAYTAWRDSHKPFHWFVEFYGIMSKRGFDVIVGNPPWREYSSVKREYQVIAYHTERCGNLYALFSERSTKIISQHGRFSFIVQLPFISSARMSGLRQLLIDNSRHLCYIPFDDRPGKLFDGLQHCRSVIFILHAQSTRSTCEVHSAKYQRWFSRVRGHLFSALYFTPITNIGTSQVALPKIASETQSSLFHRIHIHGIRCISSYTTDNTDCHYIFYQEAMQYWAKAVYGLPFYSKNGAEGAPPHGRYLYTDQSSIAYCIGAIMNSSTFYIYFITYSDCFHLNRKTVRDFPVSHSIMSDINVALTGRSLMGVLHKHAQRKTIDTKTGDSIVYEEFFAGKSKTVIDEVDRVLAKHYGFTDEELDFIINYDIKYRMGRER